jgi:hypothetical protein
LVDVAFVVFAFLNDLAVIVIAILIDRRDVVGIILLDLGSVAVAGLVAGTAVGPSTSLPAVPA